MPYNNTPINPSDDVKGTTHLPMSRVKKVLAVDDEINQVSNHAVFLCTRAAELFVRQLTEQAFAVDRARIGASATSTAAGTGAGTAAANASNKGTKKSLQYDDIARVVHRTDNLEFLCDVIPEATTYSRYKRDKRRKEDVMAEKKAKRASLAAGQTTLDGPGRGKSGAKATADGRAGLDDEISRPGTSAGAAPLDAVLNDGPGPSPAPAQQMHTLSGPDAQLNGSRDIRFKHYEPKAANGSRQDGDGDVRMDG